ncbi:MAG TPA: ferritin family protein [bacterium]|nr:ferritin family protein [bacterium]
MNIFDYAIQMEQDGEKYYRELAEKTSDKGLKNIFNMLADDEVKHREILQQIKEKEDTSMAETEILTESKNIFIEMQDQHKDLRTTEEEIDLYREAKEIEQKSVDFYKEKAAEVDLPEQKEILEKIADEEKRHYHLLDNIEELLLRPKQWVEDAEFYHLEDY